MPEGGVERQEEGMVKGHQETLGGGGCVHPSDVAMISQVSECVKAYLTIYLKYVQFMVCLLYLNKSATQK